MNQPTYFKKLRALCRTMLNSAESFSKPRDSTPLNRTQPMSNEQLLEALAKNFDRRSDEWSEAQIYKANFGAQIAEKIYLELADDFRALAKSIKEAA